VVDEGSRKLIDNAVKEDDILNENVTSKDLWLVFKAAN
jgi:syntaxin-binding protein 1